MADIPGSRRRPTHYELRLQGHLDRHWSNWFTGLTLTQNQDGTTSLCGTLADQAELHGLLAKVRDLGATLLSVTSVPGCETCTDPADAECDQPGQPDPALEAMDPVPTQTHLGERP